MLDAGAYLRIARDGALSGGSYVRKTRNGIVERSRFE